MIFRGELLDISVGLVVSDENQIPLVLGDGKDVEKDNDECEEEEEEEEEEEDMDEDDDDDFVSDSSGRKEIRKKQRNDNVVVVDNVAESTLVDVDPDKGIMNIVAFYNKMDEDLLMEEVWNEIMEGDQVMHEMAFSTTNDVCVHEQDREISVGVSDKFEPEGLRTTNAGSIPAQGDQVMHEMSFPTINDVCEHELAGEILVELSNKDEGAPDNK